MNTRFHCIAFTLFFCIVVLLFFLSRDVSAKNNNVLGEDVSGELHSQLEEIDQLIESVLLHKSSVTTRKSSETVSEKDELREGETKTMFLF